MSKNSVFLEQGKEIIWNDFESCRPSGRILKDAPSDEVKPGYWNSRAKTWHRKLLNSTRGAPDLTCSPNLGGLYRIYVQVRCVDWDGSFALKLSSEKEFQIIRPTVTASENHWDDEILWKESARMDGQEINLHNLSEKRLYLYGFRFVPLARQETGLKVSDHVVIMQEPGRHFAFPGVARAGNGDLLVVAREGVAHVCAEGKIVMARSTDQGRTWSPRTTIYDSYLDDRDPCIICLPDDTLLVSFASFLGDYPVHNAAREVRTREGKITPEYEAGFNGRFVIRSADDGRTWEGPFRTTLFSPKGLAIGADGHVYYVGLEEKGELVYTNIIRSRDRGETWEPFATTWISRGFAPGGFDYLDEPNLFISGNRWIITHRHEVSDRSQGYIYQQISDDSGASWSWPKKTVMWGHPACMVELPDGRLVCAYGYRSYAMPERTPRGIRAAVSSDRGETWDIGHEIMIRDDAGGDPLGGDDDLGYPWSIVLDNSRVLTVYYINTPGKTPFIAGSFYQPPKGI